LLSDREGSLRQETAVLPEVESIAWEYLGSGQNREGGNGLNEGRNRLNPGGRTGLNREEWNEHWSGKKEHRLPTAVRFSWRARLGELPYEWHIEVPLNVYFPPPDVLAASQGGEATARRRRFRGGESGQ
jgi:hypothetical protein